MTEHRSPQAETSQPPMPPRQTAAYLKKWFAEVGFTIDARRGQNFLIDLNLLDLLIRSAAIGPDDVVLEVGAGSGTLTTRLALLAARVVSAEIDPRLAQLTREQLLMLGEAGERVELVEGMPCIQSTALLQACSTPSRGLATPRRRDVFCWWPICPTAWPRR